MREDMARVIVERPRIKAYNNRRGRRQELEDLPAHEGMRRSRALRGDRKQLNENLAPCADIWRARLVARGARSMRKSPRIFVPTAPCNSMSAITFAILWR